MRNLLKRRERKMPDAHPKQPETLQDAVAKAIRKGDTDWIMTVSHREGRMRSLNEIFKCSMSEAATLVPDLTDWLRGNFGAGQFVVFLYDRMKHEKAQYSYGVGGAPPYKSGATASESAPAGGWGSSNAKVMEMLIAKSDRAENLQTQLLMEAFKSKNDGNSTIETLKAAADLLGSRSGNDPFQQQLMSTLIDNHFVKENNMFANLRDAMELAKTFQPAIPAEDPTTAILTSMAPLITAMIAAKSGQPVAAVMPNVVQRIQAIPDAELQEIVKSSSPAQLKAFIGQLAGGAPMGVALPPPGGTAGAPAIPPPVTAGGAVTETAPDAAPSPAPQTTPPPEADPHLAVVETMIDRLRQDIRNGVDPGVQASTLIAIVEYNRGLPSPHRLMVGLMNATGESYEIEFDRFCAAVPELSSNETARNALRMALTILLMDRHNVEEQEEEQAETEIEEPAEVDQDEAERFDPGAILTEEEVKDEGSDVPGSSGVRGREQDRRDAERDGSGPEEPSAPTSEQQVGTDGGAPQVESRKVA